MRAKAQGERVADQRQESPEEYAQGEVQQGISGSVDRVNGTTQSTARMSYRKFRMMQDRRRKVDIQDSAATTLKPPEKEQIIVPTQTERRKMFKKQRFRQKAVAAKKSAPQAPALPADILAPTLPHYRAQMQRLKRQHLTREAVRLYLQKQTATTAAASATPIVTSAPKLPSINNARRASYIRTKMTEAAHEVSIEECSGEVEETYRRLNAPIEERVEARLMWEGIRNYLPKLTPKECEVMIALYIDRLSVSEVAAKLGVETNTISTHRHNACEKIRKEMEGK